MLHQLIHVLELKLNNLYKLSCNYDQRRLDHIFNGQMGYNIPLHSDANSDLDLFIDSHSQ